MPCVRIISSYPTVLKCFSSFFLLSHNGRSYKILVLELPGLAQRLFVLCTTNFALDAQAWSRLLFLAHTSPTVPSGNIIRRVTIMFLKY